MHALVLFVRVQHTCTADRVRAVVDAHFAALSAAERTKLHTRHGTASTATHEATARHGTARHGTALARHGTARHGTARHGEA
jgi:hypothetical protein